MLPENSKENNENKVQQPNVSEQNPGERSWNDPSFNPFPEIMSLAECFPDSPCLIVELNPSAIDFSCTLRNDQPYYWCGIDAVLMYPKPHLPKKMDGLFHYQITKKAKNTANQIIQIMKKSKKPIYMFGTIHTYISEDSFEFLSKIYGIYNQDFCFDISQNYRTCPTTSKKINIFEDDFIAPYI